MKKLKNSVIVLLLFVSISAMAQNNQPQETSLNKEYVHVVYFWLKNPDNKADRKVFETSLKKFMKASKYAQTKFIGKPPKAVRDVVDDSFTYSLIASFESAENQSLYQEEAAHNLFVEECKDLWSKVIVYDSNGID